jgi:hypothetical protein
MHVLYQPRTLVWAHACAVARAPVGQRYESGGKEQGEEVIANPCLSYGMERMVEVADPTLYLSDRESHPSTLL